MERNVLIKLSYDGSKFHGWQIQENAYTVQQCFQEAIADILGSCPDIKACSRTDSGVHARVFCISMHIDNPITNERLQSALNHFLPSYAVCLSVETVADDFHARYSCLGKEYEYVILNSPVRDPFLDGKTLHYWYPIDDEKLNRAASYYLGTHDFTSFCTQDARKMEDMRRTIYRSDVRREGDKVIFTVAGDGFLYNMVRIMVGTLLRVQQNKFEPEDIPKILEAKNRKVAGPTAPADGLYLNRVFYEEDEIQSLIKKG
ncbi:MAG: tRNA pseudouridine(38-40) synthase TruA [Clostridia bacterium]|nr:tRNA pseudouridine(38-40) synthase TruA [Clostridia bacterium]